MYFLIVQINEFVKLGGDQLVPYYADILGAILPCISDKEEKIRVVGSFEILLFLFAVFYWEVCLLNFFEINIFFTFQLWGS